jgi:hypothetical protein
MARLRRPERQSPPTVDAGPKVVSFLFDGTFSSKPNEQESEKSIT